MGRERARVYVCIYVFEFIYSSIENKVFYNTVRITTFEEKIFNYRRDENGVVVILFVLLKSSVML